MLLGFACLLIGVWVLGCVFFSCFILSCISKAHANVQLEKTEHSRNRQGNPLWDWNFATSNPYMGNLVYCRFPSLLPVPALNCPGIHMLLLIPLGGWSCSVPSLPEPLSKKFTSVPCREKESRFSNYFPLWFFHCLPVWLWQSTWSLLL